MKLKTLFLIPLVLIGTLYAGFKAYVYFSVKGQLDDMIAQLSLFAAADYGGISSDIGGKLTVDNILVTPRGAATGLRVGSVALEGDGPGFLLDIAGGFDSREPPSRLRLQISDMELPLQGANLWQFPNANLQYAAAEKNKPVDPCSLAGIFNPTQANRFDRDSMLVDAVLGFELDQDTGEANFQFHYTIKDLASVALDFSTSEMIQPALMMMGGMPSLGEITLRTSLDPNYIRSALTDCSKKNQQSVAAFIETLVIIPKESTGTFSFVPGPGLRDALRQYLENPGEIIIRARPPSNINPASLRLYKPQDLVSLLGIKITVNGRPIDDPSFTFAEIGPSRISAGNDSATARSFLSPSNQTRQVRNGLQPAARKRVKIQYISTAVKDLSRYIGRDVKLYTSRETAPKTGVLIGIKGSEASVEQRLYGGKFTAHIGVDQIVRAEVLR